jgi:Ankyrin repeat
VSDRHFPVRPNLEHLKHQAKDLLRGMRRDVPGAKLAEAQHTLARSYGLPSWPRLVLACRMTDAIWRDDATAVRALVMKYPALLAEDARGVKGNWGPPMSYAANLGRDRIIEMLRELGANDVQHAFERACLQGKIATARRLYDMGARPIAGSVMGPCETLNPDGLALLLELGAELVDARDDRHAPIGLLLQTYVRHPTGKHACLDIAAARGVALPDTPPMAVHRGRIDLLEAHWRQDPTIVMRTFAHEEIFPPALGCSRDQSFALTGTPIGGGTLLHMCIDFAEMEIAQWLLAHGADVDARAAVDADGFGGHTALFGCVVTPVMLTMEERFTRLLLAHRADPNVRASLRKQLRFTDDPSLHVYRNVTPLEWGKRFHDESFVNRAAMRLIAQQ